jgi:DNA-binding CsgD family transcriptional regulator
VSLSRHQVEVIAEASYAAGSESGAEGAAHLLGLMKRATHHDAAGVLSWDALRGHHHVLANDGYEERLLAYDLGEAFASSSIFDRLHEAKIPLRIDDAPYDFRSTQIFCEVLQPAGYDDGLTICLFLSDGRYVGMLHLSAERTSAFSDDICEMLRVLSPMLARVSDLRHRPLEVLAPDFCAQIVSDGQVVELTGRTISPVLASDPRLKTVAESFLTSKLATARGLWRDDRVGWREVVLLRVPDPLPFRSPVVVAADRPRELPYGLSSREIDVLTAVAGGANNQQIASSLFIARRTVATHMEHILSKMACETRAAVASLAVREGLVRLDLPESVPFKIGKLADSPRGLIK